MVWSSKIASRKIENKIQDSANQLVCFWLFDDINKVKENIKQIEFKTLEDYTHLTTEELESYREGICDKYNALILEIQEPDLTMKRLKKIMKETFALTRIPNQMIIA